MTLDEHISRVAKYCAETKDENIVRMAIMNNSCIMDETSLLSYNIYEDEQGKHLMALFASGDGDTIYKWMQDTAKKEHCLDIKCVTVRAKALERKWGFKPIATYMELEVK